MKSILIICYEQLIKAPRVIKEINALKSDYKIYCAAFSNNIFFDINFIKLDANEFFYKNENINFHLSYPNFLRKIFSLFIKIYLWIKRYDYKMLNNFYVDDYLKLKKINYDIIIAHHLTSLPLAFRLKTKKTKVIFSAHEYYPLEFDNPEFLKYDKKRYEYLCEKYLKKCEAVLSPCEGIANMYKRYNAKSYVFENTSPFVNLKPTYNHTFPIKLVHHGICIPQRKIENILELAAILGSNFCIDLFLVNSNNEYYNYIISKAKEVKNVNIHQPISREQLISQLNQYDMGICFLPNNSFNNLYSFPNKFFEYIQARLAIVTTPMVEIARFVKKYGIGVVSENFTPESMARVLEGVSFEHINSFKNNTDTITPVYCAEKTQEKIKQIIHDISR
ncbi:MAG: glycosyltransferase [Bacteroidia bacterium]|nr:glycosyltransferase [Bacteroidia bacterium]